MAVFLVSHILAGESELAIKRRSKMLATASDLGLTGRLLAVTDPNMSSIVLVEGGPRSVLRFCRLMLRRIKWSAQVCSFLCVVVFFVTFGNEKGQD